MDDQSSAELDTGDDACEPIEDAAVDVLAMFEEETKLDVEEISSENTSMDAQTMFQEEAEEEHSQEIETGSIEEIFKEEIKATEHPESLTVNDLDKMFSN